VLLMCSFVRGDGDHVILTVDKPAVVEMVEPGVLRLLALLRCVDAGSPRLILVGGIWPSIDVVCAGRG